MYWNYPSFAFTPWYTRINRNMRCIEIPLFTRDGRLPSRLIETWDVLKLQLRLCVFLGILGLIETWDVLKLNGCNTSPGGAKGLIETWDVLKFLFSLHFKRGRRINRNMRCIEIRWQSRHDAWKQGLIETWDVLKLAPAFYPAHWDIRLIETWDVLKSWNILRGFTMSKD